MSYDPNKLFFFFCISSSYLFDPNKRSQDRKMWYIECTLIGGLTFSPTPTMESEP
jgi:hypothetical protein